MGKKHPLGLFAVLVVVGTLSWEVLRPHEPMHEGKPLSYWLENYVPRNRTETSIQLSDHAIQAIGTNAIPYMLAMLREKDSWLKLRLDALLRKQRFLKFEPLNEFQRAVVAGNGLQALRSDARTAVPSLIQLLGTNYPETSRWAAASTLGTIGPSASNAVPALVASLSNQKDSMRSYAIGALGKIHAAPDMCVPALSECLKDPGYLNLDRVWAAEALGRFGPDAKGAVPALTTAGRTHEPKFREACLKALKQIDPEAAAKLEAEPGNTKN